MKVGEIVSFRKDLLFNGAVQIGWFEKDQIQGNKAAQHFVFHGPEYHGVAHEDFTDGTHQLVDTATFTVDLLERISGKISDEPFALAIAGYGTGKSHLGLTLATLLSNPISNLGEIILNNILMADQSIGQRVREILIEVNKPYLVITINGMQDFDLTAEIVRQIMKVLNDHHLDTNILENLRPRFKTAMNFTESFYDSLIEDFTKKFGEGVTAEDVVQRLKHQDDEAFCKVNEIFEQKMSQPIRATGQESLHDFIRVTKETYCGEDKPFAGIVIIFDEFGRYLEFSVQKPHIAGSGALQKLFESVQENGDKVFLLSFIQYELKAYISRVAPELRDDLNRYVTRFDAVRKIRLSTNLETLISNLLEKKNEAELNKQTSLFAQYKDVTQQKMQRWFPDIKNYALWLDPRRFEKVVIKGCWPLHPFSTWIFYKLASVGKSLQQRSALSLLADIISYYNDRELLSTTRSIVPADLCNESLINEFLSSERFGQQGATAHAYDSVVRKYQHEFSAKEIKVLRSVLLTAKVGVKIESKDDYVELLTTFSGLNNSHTLDALRILEQEYAVLSWNERLRQYEIVDDAIPRSTFMQQLTAKVAEIDMQIRSNIFSQKYGTWSQNQVYLTDFGPKNDIPTKEWNYVISYTNVQLLYGQIDYAIRSWMDARGVDEEKGQLIYCYVGPDSSLDTVKELAQKAIKASFASNKLRWDRGVPLAIVFLHDHYGTFGEKIAQYWVLEEQLNDEDAQKFSTFIINTKETIILEMADLFAQLELERHLMFATDQHIEPGRISTMLSNLFDKIYHKRIPFPFDGFHTARGNAASDSQYFTKELFLGNLDHEWISARTKRQKNRAHSVLVEAWDAIGADGTTRLKPAQPIIKSVFEKLDHELNIREEQKALNLGAMVRKLCAPPFGCNLASAGLLLGLFVGRRRNEINLFKADAGITMENWLQDVMPGNFLDVSALDLSTIIRISEGVLSEWENLLEDWDAEKTYAKKIFYLNKAEALKEKVPVPQQCFYRYKLLENTAILAEERLDKCDDQLYDGKGKIEKGVERERVSLITHGVTILLDLKQELLLEREFWTEEQVNEIDVAIDHAREVITAIFPKWLSSQTIMSLEALGRFKHINLERVAPILEALALTSEKEALVRHVEQVEDNIRHIAAVKQAAEDVYAMITNHMITASTSVAAIKNGLAQAEVLAQRLKEASARTDIARDDVEKASFELKKYYDNAKEQLNLYQEKLCDIFNTTSLSTNNEIETSKHEVNFLLQVYQGDEQNTVDLYLILKQLELIEKHHRLLSELSISDTTFAKRITECHKETETTFLDDAPPLDYELIYEGIVKSIKEVREVKAREWIANNVPSLNEIAGFDAQKAMQTKTRLQNIPPYLSEEQGQLVKSCIQSCDDRIDELELEGMLIRFTALSDRNKQIFVKRIVSYLNANLKDNEKEGLTG